MSFIVVQALEFFRYFFFEFNSYKLIDNNDFSKEDDKSLLRISIERRNWDVVQTLLECGADPKLARVDYVNPVGTRKRSRTKDSNLMRVIQMPFDDDT